MFSCKIREFKYLAMICIFRPYKNTMGFLNYRYFSLKFDKHAHEFGIKTERQFAAQADKFAGYPCTLFRKHPPSGPREWFRRKHDKAILKYENLPNILLILDKDNYLRTYFRPIPGRQYVINEYEKP